MKRKLIMLSIIIVTLFVSITTAKAEQIEATIKITGRNTYGNELEIEVDCIDAGDSDCVITEAKWYYSDANSTENGTLIEDTSIGGSGYTNYYIEEELLGKYIYVEATIESRDSNYEKITLNDITDAENNTTAIVDDYINYIDKKVYTFESKISEFDETELKLTLKVSNNNEKSDYFVYLSNGEKPSISENSNGCSFSADTYDFSKFIYTSKADDGYDVTVSDDWYILKGYDKAYILKRTLNDKDHQYYCEVTSEPISIAKPPLPSLGSRYKIYLFSEYEDKDLNVYPLFPNGSIKDRIGTHTIITKIGLINDKELLKELAKKNPNSLVSLLEYAKKNNGTTFEFDDNKNTHIDISTFKVTDGAYYFIYTTYENSDDLYRNLEDVSVAMGDGGSLVNEVDWKEYEESDTLWDKFVEEYKKTDLVNTLRASTDNTINITSTEDSLKVEFTTTGNKKYTTNFTYANGIVTYVPAQTDEELFIDGLWNSNCILAISKLKGYDVEKVSKWLELDKKFTLDKDGIEFEIKDLKLESSSENLQSTLESDAYSSFKLDIFNGLKTFSNDFKEEEKVDSPKLGDATNIILILGATIAVGTVIYIKSKKYSKFPQS